MPADHRTVLAAKRNRERFPVDFMFRLADREWAAIRSQSVTLSSPTGMRSQIVLRQAKPGAGELGDPQQLEQPTKGAHPDGADVAALVHVLGKDRATLADDQGLFRDRTWRLHPDICAFTSELYYEGRLRSIDALERQRLEGDTRFTGAGLFLVEVPHEGNQSRSNEEIDAVAHIVRHFLAGTQWTDHEGRTRPLEPSDVLVVAPYNAQVSALRRTLAPLGVTRVGTVDKFQGQEAAIVIYSCTASSPQDAPRGMAFLYDPHRFNVATSRARGAVIVVASPALFEADCRTPEQMRWANGLCRYREVAKKIGSLPSTSAALA
jgi:uncharacterized protein